MPPLRVTHVHTCQHQRQIMKDPTTTCLFLCFVLPGVVMSLRNLYPLHAIYKPAVQDSAVPTASSNPLVVFVHGLDSSSRTWTATMEGLSLACLAVDQRGCGESPLGDPQDFCQDALVQDLHDCIEQHAPKAEPPCRLVLVGHSLGGRIVLAYGAKYPQHAAAIVMEDMDIAVRNPTAHGIIQLKPCKGVFSQGYATQAAAVQALLDVGYPQNFVDKALATDRLQQRSDGTWWSHVNPDFRKLCYPNILSTSKGKTDCQTLATQSSTSSQKIPVHVLVAGTEGTVCSEESLQEMRKILAAEDQLTIHRFPTAGHSIHSTAPDEYMAVLRNIIRDCAY